MATTVGIVATDSRGPIGIVGLVAAFAGFMLLYLAVYRELLVRLVRALRGSTLPDIARFAVFIAGVLSVPGVTIGGLLLIS